jgi:2-Cys peroxiredoxin 5
MALRIASRASQRLASRGFHTSPTRFVKAGDKIPSVELLENSPGNKVDIAKALGNGKALIVGVPAAFSTLPLLLKL